MMQKMRDPRTLKWGLWAVLILVIPSFVFFYGFGDTGTGDGPQGMNTFGTVYGERGRHDITRNEIEAARNELREQYFWSYVMTNNRFPDGSQQAMLESAIPQRRVAEQAVTMIAFGELAEASDLVVSNEQINELLRSRGITRQQLDQQLRAMRMSEAEFLRSERMRERTQRTQQLVSSAAKVSLLEMWLEYKLREDRLNATFVRVPARDLESEVEVSEDEIVAYYEANPGSFMQPEMRVYRYVVLPPPDLEMEFEVTEEDVLAEYESMEPGNDPALTVVAGRVFQIATIGEDDRETLESALQSARQGTNLRSALGDDFAGSIESRTVDFAEDADALAEEFGGEVLAAMEDLGQGQTTDVLAVNGQVMLVQLSETLREKAPLDRIRPLVEARIRSRMEADESEIRDEIIRDTMVSMMDIRRTRTSIEAIGRDLNLEVQTSAPIRSGSNFIQNVGNLFEYAELLRDMREGELSPVFRADGTDNLVILEISQITPAAVRPLDEVRSQVESTVRRNKAADLARQIAEEVALRIRSGESAANVASDLELESITTSAPFTRLQPPSQLAMASEGIANRTLQMAEGDVVVLRSGVADFTDGWVAFRLDSKQEPSRERFLEDVASLEAQLQQAKGEMFVDEFRRDALRNLRFEFDSGFLNEGQERTRRRARRSES